MLKFRAMVHSMLVRPGPIYMLTLLLETIIVICSAVEEIRVLCVSLMTISPALVSHCGKSDILTNFEILKTGSRLYTFTSCFQLSRDRNNQCPYLILEGIFSILRNTSCLSRIASYYTR